MLLKKEETLFDRDDLGELIPKIVELESDPEKRSIKITPITRGEWLKLREGSKDSETTKDQDIEIISKHCIDPKWDAKEIDSLKPVFVNCIVNTILLHSGLKFDSKKEVGDAIKKS